MNAHSLIASAGINFGVAFLVLSLFSILKKQPTNAYIYYALPLSENRHVDVVDEGYSFRRLLPSISWILAAFRVSDDEILDASGLDALVIIRLFKFGIKFFVFCSLIGVFLLAPVNFYDKDVMSGGGSYSMDSFTISNITRGSNRYICMGFQDNLLTPYGFDFPARLEEGTMGTFFMLVVCFFICVVPNVQGTNLSRIEVVVRVLIKIHWVYMYSSVHSSMNGSSGAREYAMLLGRRIQLLQDLRHRPDQFTVIVREFPICTQHKSYGCQVDHFFSKHYTESYQCSQIVYDGKDLKYLLSQAASVSQKLQSLEEKAKKQHRGPSLFGMPFQNNPEIDSQIQKLHELCKKIGQMQQPQMLQLKELPVAFVHFKSRKGAVLASQSQQHPNPLLWISESAPEPRDVIWRNLEIPYRLLPLNTYGVILLASLVTIFFAIPVTAVQGIAKFEKLKKWFPPAMAVQLIPGLRSIVTGYLPSAILNGFIYIVPFAMLGMANMADEIGESVAHPKDIPNHLARAVSAQADFFITYILTNGLSGFSLEILQPGLLCWDLFKSHTYGRRKKKTPYAFSLPYFRVLPVVCLSMLIGMVYAVVAPLLLPFLIGYFLLGYCVYINQFQDAYVTVYETCGQYWPYVHRYIMTGIVLMQITMIGMFGLKSKPAASILTIPLLLLTIIFNEYCKMRFLPSFRKCSIQTATENDELDEKAGMRESDREDTIKAYRPPFLQPVELRSAVSSYTEPLLSSVT
ncbi:unnamed protein product [Rhodiola kirilowii]